MTTDTSTAGSAVPEDLGLAPLTGVATAGGRAAASAGPVDAASEPAPPTAPTPGLREPVDEPWARGFGDPALPPDCLVAAVDGDDVYVGGDFVYGMAGMANGTYTRVARWDGTGWQPLGAGLDGAVRAVAVVGTDVYVGGDFTAAGGAVAASHLARWDGAAWSAVAGGVSDPDRSHGTTVTALACDGTTLLVGGTFTRAGDVGVRSLAALDLATGTWSSPGGGVASSWSTEPASVHALALHDGRLLVGGSFDLVGETATTGLAALDLGTGEWQAFGDGVTDEGMAGTVRALAVDEASGTVYVGGRFTHAAQEQAWNLAALRDGAFTSLGDVSSYGGKYAEVMALAVAGGRLYLGGSFTTVGNAAVSSFASYDGTAWSAVGDGVDNVVRALAATPDGGVVVLGDLAFSGDLRVVHGGVWTGERWASLGQGVTSDPYGGGTVSAVVPVGDGAYVAGLFDQAGSLRVGSVARWTGQAWDAMAGGVTAPYGHGQVFAMAMIGTDLFVGGQFATAGGVVVANVARFDGTAWSPLGEGVDGDVLAMTVLDGRLYVGGRFNRAGRVAASHLACWDPATATWSPVGGGPTYDHDVRALAAVGDRWLVVGGTFHRFFAGGTTVVEGLWGMTLVDTAAPVTDDVLSGYRLLPGVSRYGAPGWVHALQVVGGDLYVGGWFDVAGIMAMGDAPAPGFPSANLAVWHFAADGSWEPCGGTDHQVQGLAEVDGTLAAGGWFARAGDVAAARVGRYDPATRTWSPLGSGLGDGARGSSWALCLAQSAETGLWVGGQFPSAGAAPSANLALWSGTRRGLG